MALGLISSLIFCLCYIAANIVSNKIVAIIAEYERITKRAITPALSKWITIMVILAIVGTIAGCVFIFSVI